MKLLRFTLFVLFGILSTTFSLAVAETDEGGAPEDPDASELDTGAAEGGESDEVPVEGGDVSSDTADKEGEDEIPAESNDDAQVESKESEVEEDGETDPNGGASAKDLAILVIVPVVARFL
ncbi:hypothetical protein ACHWQZ_G006088 [Mnemiopsis leidyi]